MIRWNSLFFTNPRSFLREVILDFHDYLIISVFSLLFLVLFNISSSFFSKFFYGFFYDNHSLENLWTITPFFILTILVIPSTILLYRNDSCSICGVTFNAVGHQWYWSYNFKDNFIFSCDSYMLPEVSSLRLIDSDNRFFLPSSTPLRIFVTSSDVIHSWTIPSFGVKIDAIPGRVRQGCFSRIFNGVFFGQCSEICGINHSFMPIILEIVDLEDFFFIF